MSIQNRKFLRSQGLWLISTIAALVLSTPPDAGAQDRVIPPPRPRVPMYDPGAPVQKKILKNGVTILVQEQRTSDRVAGAVALRMGTLYETEEDAGRGQVLIKSIVAGTETKSPAELALRLLAADATME